MRNIAMLGDLGSSNSDICSSSQGLHAHIQATVMPEINTKIIHSYGVCLRSIQKSYIHTYGREFAVVLPSPTQLAMSWD
jgi:hypothetical protein